MSLERSEPFLLNFDIKKLNNMFFVSKEENIEFPYEIPVKWPPDKSYTEKFSLDDWEVDAIIDVYVKNNLNQKSKLKFEFNVKNKKIRLFWDYQFIITEPTKLYIKFYSKILYRDKVIGELLG
jgi:hypothetical protein